MHNSVDTFISYGRLDSKAFCIKLYQRLTEEGLKVWFDQNDIPLGSDFQNEINDGIDQADNFLFVISPHAVNSPYCLKEIEQALQRNKRIIPVLHVREISRETWQQRNPQGDESTWEDHKAMGLVSAIPHMHPQIRKRNWAYFQEDIDDFETSLAGLLEAFNQHRDYVKQHCYFLGKALEWERHQRQSRYLLVGEDREQAEAWLKTNFKGEQSPCDPSELHCEFICESKKNANNLMTQAFISYAAEDKDFMVKLSKVLMRESFTIWTNQTDINTGEEFQTIINQGIEEADNVIYLISPNSLESKYCQQELAYALSLNKRIIPLLIKETNLEQVSRELRVLQFIDFSGYEDELQFRRSSDRLIKVLHEETRYYEQHKILLAKALKWERQHCNPSILLRGHNLRQAEAWLKLAQERSQHPPTALQKVFIAESQEQPPGQSLDVFISYSRVDSDFARRLNDSLEMQGKLTWFDQESIDPGSDFQQEIYEGIESSNNFLFVISLNAIQSTFCVDEVEYALKLNKRIVTVLYRSVPTEKLHPGLEKVQWVDFNNHNGDFHANFSELVRTLDTDMEYLRSHTRLLVKAIEWDREERNPDYLLRGKNLTDAERWLQASAAKHPQATTLQTQYVITSRKAPFPKPKLQTAVLTSLAVATLVMGIRFLGLLQPLELAAYDGLMRLRPSEEKDDRLLVVEINDQDARDQINREEIGLGSGLKDPSLERLLSKLAQYKPRIIGLDIYRDFNAKVPALADRLRNTDHLVGVCDISRKNNLVGGAEPIREIRFDRIPDRTGFSTPVVDEGEMNRRQLLMYPSGSKFCRGVQESFGLVIARRYLQAEGKPHQLPLWSSDQKEYRGDLTLNGIRLPRLGNWSGGYQQNLNAEAKVQTLLKYRTFDGNPDGERTKFADHVSLAEALKDSFNGERVKDRIVLIGFTSESVSNDYSNTPYGRIPGVWIQAQSVSQILSTALEGRSLIWWLPCWGDALWIGGWALVGGLIVWRFQRSGEWFWAGGIVLGVLVGTCGLIFVFQSGWIPLVPPMIALLLTSVSTIYMTSRRYR
ncbi:TIR domain-containing protein [Kovacikia minuta CCNUW1]|uniref:TIR domain-containing protein n=1 Tax=Kovacikia minuta TaxID=2931930 RepID=UPI001CCF25EA|nr:TIR domain-containing protein [Kovacikia minuta]UBF27678.1 TIR domain-containing protein [Kovacikia minuta CCNUW1]